MKKLLILFGINIVLTGCDVQRTNNAVEAYEYWSGAQPPADMELFNGQYWLSPHWQKEYVIYLKFKPSKEWVKAFISKKGLSTDNTEWEKPNDAPKWFAPSEKSVKYMRSNINQTVLFYDLETEICYLYENQI